MKVYLFSLNPEASVRNQWDFGLLQSIFDDLGYDYSQDYNQLEYGMESGIVVIPARHHVGKEREINKELSKLQEVKLILIGDEEGEFNAELIEHKNIDIIVQNPNPEQHDKYKRLGTGIPKHMLDNIPETLPDKILDFFFAGQSTFHAPELTPPMNVNYRRKLMADELETSSRNGKIIRSKGFTQGIEPKEYYQNMASAKVVPCPSGPELPDTFRLFEALELGCVPIADEKVHKYGGEEQEYKGYWNWFFNEQVPFPIVQDYKSWKEAVSHAADNYLDLNNKCQAWWYQQKWKLKEELGYDQDITVVIPVSPIKSHPSTKIIDETIASIKYHLPKTKIIVSFDGVREEQKNMSLQYARHIQVVMYKHRDIFPIIFGEHRHQSGMMKELLNNYITSPLVLYVEQDTPLEKEIINWQEVKEIIESGKANLVRFHHESSIPKEHRHMMLEKQQNFIQTVQWSQRPHLASAAFYRHIMSLFSEDSKSFIEDYLHGEVWNAYARDGKQAYNQWRLYIYHPEGNIRRSYHTDGRAGEEKFDDTQIY